jgi:hypothetical protein
MNKLYFSFSLLLILTARHAYAKVISKGMYVYGGPLGTRLFRRKSHSFCVLEVVFLNNRAFLYKCAAFPWQIQTTSAEI